MAEHELQWKADQFDAISIVALDGEFAIEGTDGDEVELEGEFDSRFVRGAGPRVVDRWLMVQTWESEDGTEFTLRLPKHKPWVVNFSAARGSLAINDVQARLRANMGKGEIHAEDCRGILNLFSGKGEVQIENFVETDVPPAPPMPKADAGFQVPPIPRSPTPPGVPQPPDAPDTPEFVADFGRGRRARARIEIKPRARIEVNTPWDDFVIDGEEWAEWGKNFAEEMRGWATQFAGAVAVPFGSGADRDGLNLHIGKGEVEIESLDVTSCNIKLGQGDVQIDGGRIEDLDVDLAHGSAQIERVLPLDAWNVSVKHGELQVALPSDTQARLDVATRHGDIDSEVPLVRVGRPGPGSRHGGRMVGTVGSTEAKLAEIHLETLHGDIQIEWQREPSGYADTPRAERASRAPTSTESSASAMEPIQPTAPVPVVRPMADIVPTPNAQVQVGTPIQVTKPSSVEAYNSQLAVLEALRKGEITVQEAELLLNSLNA